MKSIVLSFMLTLASATLFAQTSFHVVTNEQNVALEFVNVSFLSTDSTVVGGTLTDRQGHFSYQNNVVPAKIRLSAVGYETQYIKAPYADTIKLEKTAVKLQEVTIESVRRFVSPTTNGIVVKMSGNPLEHLPNIGEAIKQMPLIDPVDGTVLGKGSPVVYINNRLLRDPSELLRITPQEVESVEIVTRPGTKYSSAVKAIIIIHTHKQKEEFAGIISANAGLSEVATWGSNMNLSYAFKNGTTLYGGASWADGGYKQKRTYTENFNNGNTQSSTDGTYRSRTHTLTANVGASYDMNTDNSLGLRYQFSRTPKSDFKSDAVTDLLRNNINLNEEFESVSQQSAQSYTHHVNGYSNNKFGHNNMFDWSTNVDYLGGMSHSNTLTGEVGQDQLRKISTVSEASYYVVAGRSDLTINLTPFTVETGTQVSYTHDNISFGGKDSKKTSFIAPADDNLRQMLYAAYVSLTYPFAKSFILTGGLRWEHNAFNHLQNNNKMEGQSKSFTDWLPNIALNYQHGNTAVNLSYRSVINRPSYGLLNNNYDYVSRTQWETGNPLLKSSLTHSVELSYMWKNTILQAMYFRQMRSIKTVYSYRPQDDVIIRQEVNLPSFNAFALVGSQSVTVKWWHAVLQGVFYWQDLHYGTPNIAYNTPGLKLTLTNRFHLPFNIYAFVGGTWSTDGEEGTLRQQAYLNLYATLYKNIKQWTFNLGFYDFANTYRSKSLVRTNGVLQTEDRKGGSRIVQLSISYIFRSKKEYRGKGAADEEIKRLSQY